LFHCPTRREAKAYPFVYKEKYYNIDQPTLIGRSDYAANAGDRVCCHGGGPRTLKEGDEAELEPPPDPETGKKPRSRGKFTWFRADEISTGVIYLRSMVRPELVSDGTSHTYLIGEKYLRPADYENGRNLGDDQGWNAGYVKDNQRWTQVGRWRTPAQDTNESNNTERFGSAHPVVMHFVFADGSIHPVSYTIDEKVHAALGNRADGTTVSLADVQ